MLATVVLLIWFKVESLVAHLVTHCHSKTKSSSIKDGRLQVCETGRLGLVIVRLTEASGMA